MARPPASLPPTPSADSPLEVQLLLGSFTHAPASIDLFKLYLPVSHPAPEHAEEHTFHPRPEIQHTFRPEQRLPNKLVSGLAAIFVAAGPWVLLLGLVRPTRLQAMIDCLHSYSSRKYALSPPLLALSSPPRCRSSRRLPPWRPCCSGTG